MTPAPSCLSFTTTPHMAPFGTTRRHYTGRSIPVKGFLHVGRGDWPVPSGQGETVFNRGGRQQGRATGAPAPSETARAARPGTDGLAGVRRVDRVRVRGPAWPPVPGRARS